MTGTVSWTLVLAGSVLLLLSPLQVCAQSNQPSSDEFFHFTMNRDFTQWDFINIAGLSPLQGSSGEDTWMMPEIGSEERPDSFSELSKVFYFQHQAPLTVDTEEAVSVKFRVGNSSSLYLVPESHSLETRWQIRAIQHYGDGTSDTITFDNLQSGQQMYLSVLPDSIIEITITQDLSPGSYPKQVWLTIVPDNEVLAYVHSAIHGMPVSLYQ